MIAASVSRVDWPLAEPFTVSRGTQTCQPALQMTLSRMGGFKGRGEACGVYYSGDTIEAMEDELAQAQVHIQHGARREDLPDLLSSGGARHLVDAALWDLEAKSGNTDAFTMAGVSPEPVTTACTIGIRSLAQYEATARRLCHYPVLKIKLDGSEPFAALAAVRRGAPTAEIIVDPNQSWSIDKLKSWAPALADYGVILIEQPIPVGAEDGLDGWRCPIPLCADELVDDIDDLALASGRFAVINIKLDKCGGLTSGLALARAARLKGFGLMVGCMGGSSLSMAPAMVLAQLCDFVDLDGPLLQQTDIAGGFEYRNGHVSNPLNQELWG
ncbi:dipeptide epimerase [Novosphingobium sp.]|uniref:dipeptide epimerase n=1 Tax=Novosphingobium sp. TaxID=1874826 RepID=UPI0025DF170A|nr:dipeptide epimerase [Novosphingobium sp.]